MLGATLGGGMGRNRLIAKSNSLKRCRHIWEYHPHLCKKNPGGQPFWTLFGPGMEGGGLPRLEIGRGVKNPPGFFAPSGGAGIPKMLTVEVQKHQYSTGFIRFPTFRNRVAKTFIKPVQF